MRYGTLLLLLLTAVSASAASRRHAVSPDRCTEILNPASLQFPAAGGHASVTVTMKGGCAISPVVSGSWITAAPAAGAVSVDVAANTSAQSRTGTIHVRSSIIVVTQDATTNLVQNGSFDTTTDGWSSAHSTAPSGSGESVNGTAQLTVAVGPGIYQLGQCVTIQPSTPYEAGVRALIPSGQTTGQIDLGIFEYAVANCTPDGAWYGRQIIQAITPVGTWFDNKIAWTSGSTARSVFVVIGSGSPSAQPFTAYFDDAYLRPKQ